MCSHFVGQVKITMQVPNEGLSCIAVLGVSPFKYVPSETWLVFHHLTLQSLVSSQLEISYSIPNSSKNCLNLKHGTAWSHGGYEVLQSSYVLINVTH